MFNNKFKNDSVSDAVEKIISETPEQIDELSKKTLGNYMRANTKRMADPKNPDSMERKMKRHDDYFTASKKFHKESELTFKDHLIDSYKNSQFDIEQIDEKEMSPAQAKKKEEIVMSMKDKTKEFKAKYGKRWKDVMYATATKMAMKEESEDHWDAGYKHAMDHALDSGNSETARHRRKEMLADNPHKKGTEEHKQWHAGAKQGHSDGIYELRGESVEISERWDDEDDDVARADRELARMKAKPIKPHEKTDPDKEISKLAKKTPKEVDEEVDLDDIYENYELFEDAEQIDEISGDLAVRYKKKALGGKSIDDVSPKRQKGITLSHRKISQSLSNYEKGRHAKVPVTWKEDVELQENYADMPHAAKELVLHADNDHHLHYSSHQPIINNLKKKMKKGTYHPEKAKKLWQYHADRAAQSYAKHHGDGTPWHKMFSTSDRKHAAAHWEDMHRHELHEAKDPSMDAGCGSEQPFVTNESPLMKKIKDVAAKAHSRIKNEMLGKAGATSEDVDPNVKTTDMLRGRVKGGKKDDVGPGADGKSTKIRLMDGEPPKE
jgi:hypothetical protein